MTQSNNGLHTLVEDALDAFWQLISHHYPTALTGDLSPWTTVKLHMAAEAAVEEWIAANVPITNA